MKNATATITVTVLALYVAAIAFLAVALFMLLTLEPSPNHLPPCATEDSNNCYWLGTEHGNGKGLSFVTINGETYYLDR